MRNYSPLPDGALALIDGDAAHDGGEAGAEPGEEAVLQAEVEA